MTERICLNTGMVHALIETVFVDEGLTGFQRMESEFRQHDMVGSLFFDAKNQKITAFCIMSQTTFKLLEQTLEQPATIEAVVDEW